MMIWSGIMATNRDKRHRGQIIRNKDTSQCDVREGDGKGGASVPSPGPGRDVMVCVENEDEAQVSMVLMVGQA